MIDPRLQAKVVEAATQAARQSLQVDLSALWEKLAEVDGPAFCGWLERHPDAYRYGAIPTGEPTALIQGTEAAPLPAIGIDGSQIYPRAESPVRWAYIQALACRRGATPELRPEFLGLSDQNNESDEGKEEENGTNDGPAIERGGGSETVNYLRTMLELQLAVELCQASPPTLTLLDSPLLPWIGRESGDHHQRLEAYLERFSQLKGGLVAGLVSGPRSRLLASLIWRVGALQGQTDPQAWGVTDGLLMAYGLKPGRRSALFRYAGPRNRLFEQAGVGIYFFFLRVDEQEVARVEVPAWVAQDADPVAQVQASILHDSQGLGYPYVLAFAHHQVSIPLEVGETLHRLAMTTYIREGGYYYLSAKLRLKKAFA